MILGASGVIGGDLRTFLLEEFGNAESQTNQVSKLTSEYCFSLCLLSCYLEPESIDIFHITLPSSWLSNTTKVVSAIKSLFSSVPFPAVLFFSQVPFPAVLSFFKVPFPAVPVRSPLHRMPPGLGP